MAIAPDVLQNLAKMADLHIETLNDPVWGGQPQVFQLRPAQLLLSAAGGGPVLRRRLSVFRDRGFSGRGATITASDLCITIVNSLSEVPPVTEPPGLSVQVGGPALDNRISSIAFL